MTTPAATDARVAPTKKVPTQVLVPALLPCTVIEMDENKTAADKNEIPTCAKERALEDEKRAITKRSRIGLIAHQGRDPAPPGLPERTSAVGPPARFRPGSARKRAGRMSASNEYGATNTNGNISNVKRL